jgi:Ca2+-binding RTX toxin-like protein
MTDADPFASEPDAEPKSEPEPTLETELETAFDPVEEWDDGLDIYPIIDAPAQTLTGTDDADTSEADLSDDTIFGGAGNDYMTGNMGNDTLFGEDRNDTLLAGAGDDVLAGGWGVDSLTGGNGDDLLNGGWGEDVIDGRDDDDSFDHINGGAGDDLLLAGAGDHLNGGDGADTFSLLTGGNNTIDDFNPAEDLLEITYSGDVPPVLTTTYDAGLATLLADDAIVARPTGVTALDTSTVLLIAA